jgi:hypothetical protein
MANILFINIEIKKYKRKFRKIRRYQMYTPLEFNNLYNKTRKQTYK